MNQVEEIIKKIGKNMKKINGFYVKTIGIFGSYVRNQQKEDSDIDLLVEFQEGKITFDNYMGLKLFLEDLFNSKIDLVIKEDVKEDLKPYILKDVIYVKGS
ncbi:MAG: nucleotidyltransferase [Candidatus Lokiarchaeota archaeon]|nr:nucleotidyltransferase [Candidatus Lokiarchaeota archaeon]